MYFTNGSKLVNFRLSRGLPPSPPFHPHYPTNISVNALAYCLRVSVGDKSLLLEGTHYNWVKKSVHIVIREFAKTK